MKGIAYFEQCTGSRVQYALSKETGQIVFIDDVRRGKDCDCDCLGCGESLIANQGDIKTHYFSHQPDNTGKSNRPCKNPDQIFETLTHEMGKKWVEQAKEILVPPYFHKKRKDSDGCEYDPVLVLDEQRLTFDRVVLENWRGDHRYRPDCTGYIGDRPVVIEIYVTHKVDKEKIEKLKADGVTAVEIVLKHAVTDNSWESIDRAMKSNRQIRWLNCPEGKTSEKHQFSERLFLTQREAFDKRQAELKARRRQRARSKAVEAKAEKDFESASEAVPELAQKKVEGWYNRYSSEILTHKDELLRHAAQLDRLLLSKERSKHHNSLNSSNFWRIDDLQKLFREKIDMALSECRKDLLKGYQAQMEAELQYQLFLKKADAATAPVSDSRWDYAEQIEEEHWEDVEY